RDAFGVRPLVWADDGDTVWLASEASALLAAGWPARWDAEAVAQCFSFQYLAPGQTPFEGIHSLPPGHLLVAEHGAVRVVRWWEPDAGHEERSLLDTIRDAVRARLRADVPVGVQLSGGIDSAAVAALCAE